MINQIFLLGRIKNMSDLSNNKVEIEIKRNYKNIDGVFENDCFTCNLWIALSKKIGVSCREGDLVAVKGRLVSDNGVCNILAEQVILLNKMV